MNKTHLGPTRRNVLATGSLMVGMVAGSGVKAVAAADDVPSPAVERVRTDLLRYVGFGIKASGGPGDNACGEWLESELQKQGFKVDRQIISVPFFEEKRGELVSAGHTAPVIPQAIVVSTPDSGVTGRIVRVDPQLPQKQSLSGAIALIDLPFARHSTALEKPVQVGMNLAVAGGARAAVLITNGPSNLAIALNADGNKPMFPIPTAILAPETAQAFLVAAEQGETATLYLTGKGGRRDAFNLLGRMDRGKSKWIVVSTPRSGWFVCAGERGPGIAVWLSLARWAPAALKNHNLAFICNSAHEYEYLGAGKSLKTDIPKPEDTAIWLALGAAIAARDWHELPSNLLPLPSADPQRFLVVSPSIRELARKAFAGQPGIEAPYETQQFTAGELTSVHEAGYKTVAGFFGVHRFHHTKADNERCLAAEPTWQAVLGCQTLLQAIAN